MTELNEIAHPRALEPAQNRAPGTIVINKNKLRRINARDENIVWGEIAVQITGAMQAGDFRAECAQDGALGRERLALRAKVARSISSLDTDRHHDLAAALLFGAEQQNFRNADPVNAKALRNSRDVLGARSFEDEL